MATFPKDASKLRPGPPLAAPPLEPEPLLGVGVPPLLTGGVVAAPGLALGWGVGGLDLATGAGVCGLGVMARPRFASYCTNCWGFAKAVPGTTRFSLSHVARLAITNFW